MTLPIASPPSDEKSENDEHLPSVSYQEPLQQLTLPYVQLCIRKNDNDPDMVNSLSVYPIVIQNNDVAETIEESLPLFSSSSDLEDESNRESRDINQSPSSLGQADLVSNIWTIYEITEENAESCSESSSSSSFEEEGEQKLSRDGCSRAGETLSTASTTEFWWNFDAVDWHSNFQHFPNANDRHVHNQISRDPGDSERSAVWYFGVPNLDDFGTNVVLLDQRKKFCDLSENQMFTTTTDATCGQWLHRILILPQKRGYPGIQIQKSVSSCTEYPKPTILARRSYLVLR
jgi:hypothetical protein